MLSPDTVSEMEEAVEACDTARSALVDALDAAEAAGGDVSEKASLLERVAESMEEWRDAQERFMALVDASAAPNPSTAALLLKTNHGIDASNARCGLPGASVDGADQPFDVDMSGTRGTVLTEAATEYLS